MGLLHDLLPAVVESALNPAVLGNEDRERWPAGTPTPSPQDSAQALAWVLSHADGLEWLYERVDDDASRRVLLGRLAYAVLGHGRIVVGPGPQRWTELVAQARAELLVEADLCDLDYGDGTHTHRFDLRPLGFPIDLEAYLFGAQGTFQLQQYRCPQHPAARIRPGDVVLDGGAFFGETALWAAHEAGPDGRVIALEFAEHNLPFLHRNLVANPALAGRVEVVERALWDASGVRLPVSLGGPATTVHDKGVEAYTEVESVTVDDLLDGSRLDFLKLDIEGAEPEALRGAEQTFRRWRPRFAIAAYHEPDHVVELARIIDGFDLGYSFALAHFTIHDEETVLYGWTR